MLKVSIRDHRGGNCQQELQERRAAMPVGPDAGETNRTPPAPNSQPIFGSESESRSIATETSSTTPGKVVKKARAEGPEPKSLFQSEASPVPSQPDTGATNPPSLDDLACLRQRNQELENEKIALEKQVEELNEKLSQMSLNQGSQEQSGDDGANAPPASDDAARKRLARICSRNSAGKHGWYRGG